MTEIISTRYFLLSLGDDHLFGEVDCPSWCQEKKRRCRRSLVGCSDIVTKGGAEAKTYQYRTSEHTYISCMHNSSFFFKKTILKKIYARIWPKIMASRYQYTWVQVGMMSQKIGRLANQTRLSTWYTWGCLLKYLPTVHIYIYTVHSLINIKLDKYICYGSGGCSWVNDESKIFLYFVWEHLQTLAELLSTGIALHAACRTYYRWLIAHRPSN